MPAVNRPARARAAAPSPTDPADKAAAEAIAVQLRAMTAEHDKAVTGDVEAIHRLRVATRRLRAALRMLREVAPSNEADSAADELGWLCGAIGAVRDLDVLAQLLEERATRLETDFIRALEPLSVTIRRQRATGQERLVAALDSERYRGLVQRLGAIAPEPAAHRVALGAVAARLVRSHLRAMLRAGAGLDESSPAETLHRLRVRVKKLRYALEPLRAVGGKPVRRMLRRLERVQERVGLYHDAAAAAAWLRGWAAESHDAPPADTQPQSLAPRGDGRPRPRCASPTQLCSRPGAARRQAAARPGPAGSSLMTLYVLRHGAAENEPPAGSDDGARRLTARGREKVREAAAGMRALGLKFDPILASPLPRAAETAELVAAVCSNGAAPEAVAALSTGVSPADTVAALKPYERHNHLLIVGHEPGLSGIVSLLLTGSATSVTFDLKKSGMIALELHDGIERGGAQLLWMFTSRQLRRLRK